MTCIIGLVEDGRVYMVSDSAASGGNTSRRIAGSKIAKHGDFLVGASGSTVTLDVISELPSFHVEEGDDIRKLVFLFSNMLREKLKELDLTIDYESATSLPSFSHVIVGVAGRLFTIQHDFSIIEYNEPFASIGSCDEIVLGAISVTPRIEPIQRLTLIMDVCSRYAMGVSGPYHFLTTP